MYRKSLNSKKNLAVCQNIEQLTVYIKILNKLSKNNCSFCVCCLCSTEGCFATEKALSLYLVSWKINGVKGKNPKAIDLSTLDSNVFLGVRGPQLDTVLKASPLPFFPKPVQNCLTLRMIINKLVF